MAAAHAPLLTTKPLFGTSLRRFEGLTFSHLFQELPSSI
jgi:hypothetical protein